MNAAKFVLRLETGERREEMVFYSTETPPAAEWRKLIAGNFNTFYYSKLCIAETSISAGIKNITRKAFKPEVII